MQIGKYPRTLQEAFGPYTSSVIHERRKNSDQIVVVGCVIAIACLAAILLVWP